MRPSPFVTTKVKWAVVAALLLTGLVWLFVHESRRVLSSKFTSWDIDPRGDCAVVLTGGPNRVRKGFDLLSQGQVKKLILSGVNPRSSLREIFPQMPFYGALSENEVILEKRSATTYGNAQQTLALIEALHCRDLVVVTSRVHMYRAIRTFKAIFPPNYPLIEYAVIGPGNEADWDEIAMEVTKSVFYSLWTY
ncbi:MAG: YdcF family protein [Bdellovibrionia bacterium]